MTHLDRSPEVERYFALRDKVARLLKEAGVKKAARGYVAEVLIDAGVIDFGELETEDEKGEDLTARYLDKEVEVELELAGGPIVTRGKIVTTYGNGLLGFWARGTRVEQAITIHPDRILRVFEDGGPVESSFGGFPFGGRPS